MSFFRQYDTVLVKKTGQKACIVEIDDNNGMDVPIYMVEVIDKPDDADVSDVLFWCDRSDLEKVDD